MHFVEQISRRAVVVVASVVAIATASTAYALSCRGLWAYEDLQLKVLSVKLDGYPLDATDAGRQLGAASDGGYATLVWPDGGTVVLYPAQGEGSYALNASGIATVYHPEFQIPVVREVEVRP